MNKLTRKILWFMPYGPVCKASVRKTLHQRSQQQIGLFSKLIKPRSLVFDVGANLGNRIDAYLHCGCTVVAVEPQPKCVQFLKSKYQNRSDVAIVQAGAGSAPGKLKLHFSREGEPIASFSDDFVSKMKATGRFGDEGLWSSSIEVDIVTLDSLVAKHGVPNFIKIDVEGFEREVLAGLHMAPDGLSFEYTPDMPASAVDCVDHCLRLGLNYFQFSFGEDMRLFKAKSVGAQEAKALIGLLSEEETLFGDIYATKQPIVR